MAPPRITSLAFLFLAVALQGCPTPEPEPDAGSASDSGVVHDGGNADGGNADGGDADGGDADGGDADGGDTDGGPTPTGIPFDDFCPALHEAVCAGFASCGCSLEGRSFTLDDCVEARAAACEEQLSGPAGAIAAGVLAFDEERATRCVERVTALADGCHLVSDETLPRDCAMLFVSTAALGEGCDGVPPGVGCAEGAGVCVPGAAAPECEALPGDGELCGAGLCQDGLECDPVSGTCRPPLALGDECQGGGCPAGAICFDGHCRAPLGVDEGPCRASFECASGLVCNDDGVCATGPARGDPCDGPICASGDACVREYDQRSCAPKVADGEACVSHDECANGFCASSVGVCAPLPGEGDPCPDGACEAGFACDYEQGAICVVAPGENEACLIGPAACAPGLGCNANNVCVPGPGVGEECLIPDNLCADGLGCDFTRDGSFCVERRGTGEPCESDVCQEGLYCDFTTNTCEPTLAVGEACPTGGGCAADDECGDLLGGFRCHDVPDAQGAPCYGRCGGDLACRGPGGVCAPEICASP